MERSTPLIRFPFSWIICTLFGHRYSVSRKITEHINEYKCDRCNKEVTNNYSGKIELLTKKRKEVNECLYLFFRKKSKITAH